jgi:hypothetical protein
MPSSDAASAMIMGLPIARAKHFSEIRQRFCAIEVSCVRGSDAEMLAN